MNLDYEKVYVYNFHINYHLQDIFLHLPALNYENIYNENTMYLYTITIENAPKDCLLI